MSRFHTDDVEQKAVRDAVLGPGLYGQFAVDGRYVYLDRGNLATLVQKRLACDTVFQRRDGSAVFVEEKIVRWPGYEYNAITLETDSCTVPGHESKGWMHYGKADWLNYAMCQADGNVVCHIIDFPKLKDCFWRVWETFDETITEQHNKTACRKVPLSWIRDNVPIVTKKIHATPEGMEAVKRFNEGHYKK